jgi:hypothetical protein
MHSVTGGVEKRKDGGKEAVHIDVLGADNSDGNSRSPLREIRRCDVGGVWQVQFAPETPLPVNT